MGHPDEDGEPVTKYVRMDWFEDTECDEDNAIKLGIWCEKKCRAHIKQVLKDKSQKEQTKAAFAFTGDNPEGHGAAWKDPQAIAFGLLWFVKRVNFHTGGITFETSSGSLVKRFRWSKRLHGDTLRSNFSATKRNLEPLLGNEAFDKLFGDSFGQKFTELNTSPQRESPEFVLVKLLLDPFSFVQEKSTTPAATTSAITISDDDGSSDTESHNSTQAKGSAQTDDPTSEFEDLDEDEDEVHLGRTAAATSTTPAAAIMMPNEGSRDEDLSNKQLEEEKAKKKEEKRKAKEARKAERRKERKADTERAEAREKAANQAKGSGQTEVDVDEDEEPSEEEEDGERSQEEGTNDVEKHLRSLLNKTCRVEFQLEGGTAVRKHPAIPVRLIRCLSISEGQRPISEKQVLIIRDRILKNPHTTVNALSVIVLDEERTPADIHKNGVTNFYYGTTGGNHYIKALHLLKKESEEFYNNSTNLHSKDGEIYAFGILRKLLKGTTLTHTQKHWMNILKFKYCLECVSEFSMNTYYIYNKKECFVLQGDVNALVLLAKMFVY